MADPNRDPHHPSHPGNYSGKIPDSRTGRGGRSRIGIILAVIVVALALGWFLTGADEPRTEHTLGEPAGFGEAATEVDREAEMPEEPHEAIGAASEPSTVLAPDAIDRELEAGGETEPQ